MYSLILDPYILAAPDDTSPLVEFEMYIENLRSWRDFLDAPWLSIYAPANLYELLYNTGHYPVRSRIESAISHLGLVNVQTRDIVDLVNALLYRTPVLETALGISTLEYDNVIASPTNHLEKRPVPYREQYARLLVLIFVAQIVNSVSHDKVILITKDLDEAFQITTLKADVECAFVDEAVSHAIPSTFQCRISTCNSPQGLFLAISPVVLWQNAPNLPSFNNAIKCQVYHRAPDYFTNSSDLILREWSFHPRFFETAQQHGFLHDPLKVKMLLRTCVDTLLRENMAATHALRAGKSGNEAQIKRGSDGAWRRDIDHEYHLHYWETASGPEFTSVVVHNDFSIEA